MEQRGSRPNIDSPQLGELVHQKCHLTLKRQPIRNHQIKDDVKKWHPDFLLINRRIVILNI
jgi:hypothetical protein